MLERVRSICETLPEVEESIDGFGDNVMKVRGKSFVIMGENNGSPMQYLLLQQGGYVRTPYIGQDGWVSLDQAVDPNWGKLADLIKEAYLRAAPKRLVKQVLGSQESTDEPN